MGNVVNYVGLIIVLCLLWFVLFNIINFFLNRLLTFLFLFFFIKSPIKKLPTEYKYSDVFKRKIIFKKKGLVSLCFKYGLMGFRSLSNFKVTFKELEAIRRIVSFN